MIGLTIFWCVIGGLLAILGYYLICKSRKGRKYTVSPVRLEKDGAEELLKARNALARLTRKQEAEVLAAFAQWGLDQEEENEIRNSTK